MSTKQATHKTKSIKTPKTAKKSAKSEDFSLFGEILSPRFRTIWRVLLVASQIVSFYLIVRALVLYREAEGADLVFVGFTIAAHIILIVISLLTKHGSSLLVISLAELILFTACAFIPAYYVEQRIDLCRMCDGFTVEKHTYNAYGKDVPMLGDNLDENSR